MDCDCDGEIEADRDVESDELWETDASFEMFSEILSDFDCELEID
ncbi:MAG TPA: hypothetical protein VL688_12515 [Verrucomicrobiae bacterium]|nr:hypothetical protein [Verrucomicrobiae bacterium]